MIFLKRETKCISDVDRRKDLVGRGDRDGRAEEREGKLAWGGGWQSLGCARDLGWESPRGYMG